MARRRHTPEQVIGKLREADRLLGQGKEVGEVCRHLEISEATYHRWQRQFGGMKVDDVKRLKELERENQRSQWTEKRGPSSAWWPPRGVKATMLDPQEDTMAKRHFTPAEIDHVAQRAHLGSQGRAALATTRVPPTRPPPSSSTSSSTSSAP